MTGGLRLIAIVLHDVGKVDVLTNDLKLKKNEGINVTFEPGVWFLTILFVGKDWIVSVFLFLLNPSN